MTPAEVARLRSIIAGATPGDRPEAIRAVVDAVRDHVEELTDALSELAKAQREVTALRAQVADLTVLPRKGE